MQQNKNNGEQQDDIWQHLVVGSCKGENVMEFVYLASLLKSNNDSSEESNIL